MTDCPNGDMRDLLPDFLHGRLDPSRRAEVERHAAGCEACQEELSLLRDLRATMARVPHVNVNAIAAAIPPYRAPARQSWGSRWRTAAAIAAIVVGTSFALLKGRSASTRHAAPPSVAVTTTPTTGRDSASVLVVAPTESESPVVARGSESATARIVLSPTQGRELAMAGGAIGELSDRELSALLNGIESLDAVPSSEVEGAEPVGPSAREEQR